MNDDYPILRVNRSDPRFTAASATRVPYYFTYFTGAGENEDGELCSFIMDYSGTTDDWAHPGTAKVAKRWTVGLAMRAFGLDRVCYYGGTDYREASAGYFDRPIPTILDGTFNNMYNSHLHNQEANRDNLFLAYYRQDNKEIDMLQIAP